MYAITGITGNVGGELAGALLAAGQRVRAIVRDARKGEEWAARGCEVAVATMDDAAALTRAFEGAKGAFILPPPDFDPEPDHASALAVISAVATALRRAAPGKIVCLSTIGADAAFENLLSPRGWMEAALLPLSQPLTILRPAWFLENAAWDVASARDTGVVHSFLYPLDKAFPMVSAKDLGQTAAKLLQEDWIGARIVELEGPRRVSPNDLALAFAHRLARPCPVRRGRGSSARRG
jgi:NAD(P)H dehydrogenase (quinone)